MNNHKITGTTLKLTQNTVKFGVIDARTIIHN